MNITVDDTDPSIVYQRNTAWFFNGNSSRCTFCLTPPSPTIAYNSTWHHGLHVIPTQDLDDPANSTVDGDPPVMRRRRSEGEPKVVGRRDTSGYNNTYDPTNGATTSPFLTSKFDSDDANFQDFPVSVQLNFTGKSRFHKRPIPYRFYRLGHLRILHSSFGRTTQYQQHADSHESFFHLGWRTCRLLFP